MKFIIVLACLIALAYANHDARTLHDESEVNPDSFRYSYETDNHIKADQHGALHDNDNWIVGGEYTYKSPDGQDIKVTYTADENGYHPVVHL